jgi:hypothetical protein
MNIGETRTGKESRKCQRTEWLCGSSYRDTSQKVYCATYNLGYPSNPDMDKALLLYQTKLRAALPPSERRSFNKLSSPQKIQAFLDSIPENFPTAREGIQTPRQVLKSRKAQCIEGAVLAATALAYHGREPLLMDFQTTNDDEDHVLSIFKEGRYWGAISKTNHPVLRWRDPIYQSLRELAMSYFHEYYLWNDKYHKVSRKNLGKKTLRTYSAPFDLKRYSPKRLLEAKDLDWLAEDLDISRHFPTVPKGLTPMLRLASRIETEAMKMEEWSRPKK